MLLVSQFLFILVGILGYFGGGLVASMSLSELKTAAKYVPFLLGALLAILLGALLLPIANIYLVMLISIVFFVLIMKLLKIELLYFVIIIYSAVLLQGQLILIQIGLAIFLFKGILDYNKYRKKKGLHFAIRSLTILIIGTLATMLGFFLI